MRSAATATLFAAGYPVAIVVIVRLVPVLRDRRRVWFSCHEAATAAITVGWALSGQTTAVAVNGAWFLLVAAAWGVIGVRGAASAEEPGSP